jgi:integrin-linked kinase
MGQNLNRIPYKDTFWKGTTRTRPRESLLLGEGCNEEESWAPGAGLGQSLVPDLSTLSGNGTLNKHSGIDFKQLNFVAKLNENHSGEVTPVLLAPPFLNPTDYLLCTC